MEKEITLGERLKELRGTKTQEMVSQALGLSRARYSHYENNRVEPDSEILNKMADFFCTSIDFLLGRTNDPEPQVKKEEINSAFYTYEKLTDEEKEYLDMQLELFRDMKKKKNK